MSRLHWYKRDPDAALVGMMGLTLEERGAYNTVLDLIYSHEDQLPDDDRFLAGWCQCDIRVWKRLKLSLIKKKKLTVTAGLLRNFRATSEVDAALLRLEVGVSYGHKSGAKRSKNKGLSGPNPRKKADTTTTTTTSTSTSIKKKPESDAGASQPPADLRHALFNQCLSWIAARAEKPPDKLRPMLGRWCRDYGDGMVMAAIGHAATISPVEPISWIEQHLRRSGGGTRHRDAGGGMMAAARMAMDMMEAMDEPEGNCSGANEAPGGDQDATRDNGGLGANVISLDRRPL